MTAGAAAAWRAPLTLANKHGITVVFPVMTTRAGRRGAGGRAWDGAEQRAPLAFAIEKGTRAT